MKILLSTLNSKYVQSNLAIRYLRSSVKDLPLEISLQEYNINQRLEYIIGEIYRCQADLLAFSCYIWNLEPTLEICQILKQVAPEIRVVLGGPEVSFQAEKFLVEHPYIDYIVRGEGEETFRQLLLALLHGSDLIELPGLTSWHKGQVVSGRERPLLTDLDQIPSPFSEHLEEYENKLVYYESSRGCPFNCQYCLSATIPGVRTFSMERIQTDLWRLITAEVAKVKFVDRTFNYDAERALKIMRFLVKHQRKTRFHFEITAHLLTDEILSFLRDVPVGLFQFEIGVQSTNSITLKEVSRKDDFHRLSEVVKTIKSYDNIHLHLDLISGLPKEDYQSFQRSFNDAFHLRPDNLQLGFLKLLKGSKIREHATDYGYRYLPKPPYEVLLNESLSFDQILELKQVEDLLEKYYNSHKFTLALDFIITRYYSDNPYRFFQELTDRWLKKGYHRAPLKDIILYQFLWEFYQQISDQDIGLFKEYLKFDFLCQRRTTNLPRWLSSAKMKDFKDRCFQFVHDPQKIQTYLPSLVNLPGKQILRRILIEPFAFDLLTYQQNKFSGKIPTEEIYILFDYESRDARSGEVHWCQIDF